MPRRGVQAAARTGKVGIGLQRLICVNTSAQDTAYKTPDNGGARNKCTRYRRHDRRGWNGEWKMKSRRARQARDKQFGAAV